MRKKFTRLVSTFIFTVFFMSFANIAEIPRVYSQEVFNSTNSESYLKIDSKKKAKMPKRFRKTTDNIDEKDVNLKGLSTLNASGSAQFTGNNIKMMKEQIGNVPTAVVDLRQESHGFINDLAVSWVGEDNNKANKGLSREKVLKDESKKIKSIVLNEEIDIDGKEIVPTKVQSEKELVEENGMTYIRIPVTDNERPADEMVDYFIKVVKNMPKNTWYHFHCKAGIGRTTTFMAMYDMMKNSKEVSLEDIMERQVLLGGKNLLKPIYKPESFSGERSEFIKKFYEYTKENKDDFNTTWSQWLKTGGS
ncbi:fused DSP-PTPase phosphatase/NAD kinase-like protein [Clostridium sp. HV4-5-A1G]|uniref:fused DSP-PTPase phosphatase/NAD kinase-like protein n=1 Tax=Clostridium sp. HV4-5-A1G TaxID=2004595 RepID=UPI00123939A7|nr:dual specificity protein phosphatase family protein [Clostridium sp. HV4-5-A1G]KAA8667986.1 phosphatase [Clostridium sp. HV4-5-A1G]